MFKFLIASTIITVASSSTPRRGAPSVFSQVLTDPADIARAEHFVELATVLEEGNGLPFVRNMKDFTWMAINDNRIVDDIYEEATLLSSIFNEQRGIAGSDVYPDLLCLAAVSSFSKLLGPDQDVDSIFGRFTNLDAWLMVDSEGYDGYAILETIIDQVSQLVDEHGENFSLAQLEHSALYHNLSAWAAKRVRDEEEIASLARQERKRSASAPAAHAKRAKISQPNRLRVPAAPVGAASVAASPESSWEELDMGNVSAELAAALDAMTDAEIEALMTSV